MKYYQLVIFTDDTADTYQKITHLLGVEPIEEKEYGVWTYSVDKEDESAPFDFINIFLDLLEPRFEKLGELGVTKNKILFWLLYAYEHQCALGFSPQEMQRLGANGIALNIDCWEPKK